MSAPDLLIIGAGPTGLALGAAYGQGACIVEREDEVGGLCRSIEFGGGVFDLGGHSFHSPHPEVLDLVERTMAGRWSRQRRDARVFFDGQLIDYPFQANFRDLRDAAVVAECLSGAPDPDAVRSADNLQDWIAARFGAGVSRHFMLPYNRKLWARDLRRISRDWVGQRIAGAESDGAPPATRRPLQSDSEVAYPAEGGFVEIFRALAKSCDRIELGQEIRRIDPAKRLAFSRSGDVWPWRRLVSTLPLPLLLRAVDGCPEALVEACDALETVSLKIVMLLVDGPVGDAPQRVYVAAPEMPAHKIAFNHTSSASLRARAVQAVMAEVAYSPQKPAPADADLARGVVDWLAGAGLIAGAEAVLERRIVDLPYGYPVDTPGRAATVAAARAWLEGQGIHTLGRFGAWEYVNSDACLRQGLQLGESLRRQRTAEAM